LFYQYHALEHFQYANTHKGQEPMSVATFETRFIRYEALGEAILRAEDPKKPCRSVVLIDEIDKAPRDLPNDLLAAIDTLRFEVPEIPSPKKIVHECPKELKPVIIITSNSEKNLPDAFLRRVVYYHIPFPDHAALLSILEAKSEALDETKRKAIVQHFEHLRNDLPLNKKPATAELIFWAFLLHKLDFPIQKLLNLSKLTNKERQLLETSYSVLAKTRDDLETMRSALKTKKRPS
jgi:MoxR-like ATPase